MDSVMCFVGCIFGLGRAGVPAHQLDEIVTAQHERARQQREQREPHPLGQPDEAEGHGQEPRDGPEQPEGKPDDEPPPPG